MSYIELKHISKTIKSKPILSDIHLNLEKGHIYGIIGSNGSGKSMLFRAICGFMKLDQGEVKINGQQVKFGEELPVSTGLILETPGFILHQTALENLRYLAEMDNAYNEDLIFQELKYFGLYEHRNDKVKNYSLGMKQKLAIIQAIMENQELLLLDEPTNALDKESIERFQEKMLQLKDRGKTILIATHDDRTLQGLTNELIELYQGKIVEQ